MARYVTLRDALRRPHEFMLSAIGLEYPDEPGVYAFVVDHRSDFEVLYVSETSNLNNRLTYQIDQFPPWLCAERRGAGHVVTRPFVGDDKDRAKFAQSLKVAYDPPCNREFP